MTRRLGVIAAGVWLLAAPAWAATFTVDSTGDDPDASPGDGTCATAGGACTLRAAIDEVNAHPDADTIAFDIAGSGVHTIVPAGGLPSITAPLTIDGFTQPGSQPNTSATGAIDAVPLIEIDGSSSIDCVVVSNASNPGTVTIRGLVINRCSSSHIDLESGSDAVIEGNFIGTDATGTMALGGGSGISMFVQSGGLTFTAGGTTPAARNVISGTENIGIDAGANLNSSILATIQGNLIGTDKTGTVALGNNVGIVANGQGSDSLVLTIGGSAAGAGNVISANTNDAVNLAAFTANSVVQGNLIGTAVDGTSALGNGASGIHAVSGPLTIGGTMPGEGNVVAHNDGAGIFVESSDSGFFISSNSIFANGGLGIDLQPPGVNANDFQDPDTGANGLQNFPVLAAGDFPGGTSVDGTLNSTPNTTFRVEVFANDACDPSGNGEGQTFVGANDSVMTDADGDASFTVSFAQPLAAGTVLTATAIAPDDSTSELSACTGPTTTTTTSTTTSTTETTTTTTAGPPTTTTTLPGNACDGVPSAPTFRSLDCRLAALGAEVTAASDLGPLQTKLRHQLEGAKEREERSEARCRAPNLRRAKSELAQAIRKLSQVKKTLRSRKAQRTIATPTRDALLAAAEGLRTDLGTLRGALRCPDDAPPP